MKIKIKQILVTVLKTVGLALIEEKLSDKKKS